MPGMLLSFTRPAPAAMHIAVLALISWLPGTKGVPGSVYGAVPFMVPRIATINQLLPLVAVENH